MLDWSKIDTVLLDMDGTLLDLRFDNHFWLEHVPLRYAEKNALALDEAKAECRQRYAKRLGTLSWYSVEHWSEELDLDIAALKAEVDHLIEILPGVIEFLQLLKQAGKKRVLATNAHDKSLTLKMLKTNLDSHLDDMLTSHQIGVAKEHPEFWPKFQTHHPFVKERSLFIDDSLSVLRTADRYGIGHLLAMRQPDRMQPARDIQEFPAIVEFDTILPGLKDYVASMD